MLCTEGISRICWVRSYYELRCVDMTGVHVMCLGRVSLNHCMEVTSLMTLLLQMIEANYLLGTKIVWSGITSTSRCMHWTPPHFNIRKSLSIVQDFADLHLLLFWQKLCKHDHSQQTPLNILLTCSIYVERQKGCWYGNVCLNMAQAWYSNTRLPHMTLLPTC